MCNQAMTPDERKREIDRIREIEERLKAILLGYGSVRYMAEQPIATDAFVKLAKAAGELALDRLSELGLMMEIMLKAGDESHA